MLGYEPSLQWKESSSQQCTAQRDVLDTSLPRLCACMCMSDNEPVYMLGNEPVCMSGKEPVRMLGYEPVPEEREFAC